MTRPGIRKSLEDMQALCVSVIFAEHSFCDNPRNTQCSNATDFINFSFTPSSVVSHPYFIAMEWD